MSATKNVQFTKLGWQKLDVTSSVRQWYADGAKSRLRLLIDCSGCGDLVKIHLFNDNPAKKSTKLNDGIIIVILFYYFNYKLPTYYTYTNFSLSDF